MMKVERAISFAAVLALLIGLCLPGAAQAQGVIIEPPPRPPMPPIAWMEGITVDEHHVDVALDGPLAQVKVTQVFHNRSNQVVEGTYVFPLPPDAAVGDFQMTVDGQVLEGVLMPQDQARRIYEEIVRQMRDPALLEYLGRGLFQTSVFPIPPGATRTVQLTYGQVVEAEDGLRRFDVPLRVPGASTAAERTSLHTELASASGLRVIYSPSHVVSIVRPDAHHATVDYASSGGDGPEQANTFTLFYGESDQSVGLNLLSYRPAGDDGYFALLVAPTVEAAQTQVVRRDVVVALDVSGSMEGPKLAQAKDAITYVVEHLNPGDRFNLIAFSTGVRLWSDALQEATPQAAGDARAWIDDLAASGSTDINRGLLEALAQFNAGAGEQGGAGYVLFMTDGLPTQGETDAAKIVRNAAANLPANKALRLFTFGVGYDVNTDLLDTVSRQLGGRSSYVRPDAAIDEAVSQFYSTIQTPVLTNVSVDFREGVVASDVYPFPLPDLFAGEQLVLTGRYREGATATVTVSGEVNGEKVRYVYPGQSLAKAGGEPFIARLWATRKVGVLLDEIRRSGPQPELIDAIVDLSLQYGIVTPYTSYLVEEPAGRGDASTPDGEVEAPSPRAMAQTARDAIQMGAAEAAAAPASGEAAVDASQARAKMQSADVVAESAEVRYAGGRAFILQGRVTLPDGRTADLWVDTGYDVEMALEPVAFTGDHYFELAADADMAEMLALSSEMVIVIDGDHAIRITAAGEPASADAATDVDAAGETSDPGVWQSFWEWLLAR